LGGAWGLSQPAAWRRVKRLEEAGDSGRAAGDGGPRRAWLWRDGVSGGEAGHQGRVSLEDFERAVTAIPEVQVVQHVLGLFDYRLRVVARDIADFERVLRRRIMTLPGVGQVEANVLLSEERRPGPWAERGPGEGWGEGCLPSPQTPHPRIFLNRK
jgi:Lrp/AsnC family transcriptional regulator, leucine-responsive regulatory protein